MYGHVINVPTHHNVKLPVIGRHLPNQYADSHLLVVRTCYNGQCKQMPSLRWSFQPKIADGATRILSCDRQFAEISMLPSGDRKQYQISRLNACVMNHVIVASQTIGLRKPLARNNFLPVLGDPTFPAGGRRGAATPTFTTGDIAGRFTFDVTARLPSAALSSACSLTVTVTFSPCRGSTGALLALKKHL